MVAVFPRDITRRHSRLRSTRKSGMALSMIRRKLISKPIPFPILSHINLFHTASQSNPSSHEFRQLELETQVLSLCQNPDSIENLRRACSVFEQSVGTGVVPSDRTCARLLSNLVKKKEHRLALGIYKKAAYAGVSPRQASSKCLIESLAHLAAPKSAMGSSWGDD